MDKKQEKIELNNCGFNDETLTKIFQAINAPETKPVSADEWWDSLMRNEDPKI